MPEDDPIVDPAPVAGGTSTVRSDGAQLQSGQRIGHYKILEQIGEGGFAIVYLAEQEKPVRRRVALKTPGLASPASLSCPDDRSRSCQFVR